MEERLKPATDEFDKPLSRGNSEPLELLPDREWLRAKVHNVEYQISYFNNKPITVTDSDDNEILDDEGNPIYRREFKITFYLQDFCLKNGDARQAWLHIGASLGKKANLPKFLANLFGRGEFNDLSPKQIVAMLDDKNVKLQMANKVAQSSGNTYQQVVWDAVKLEEKVGGTVSKDVTGGAKEVQPPEPDEFVPPTEE